MTLSTCLGSYETINLYTTSIDPVCNFEIAGKFCRVKEHDVLILRLI